TSIVPCPYCDGFEVAGQHWGLVWSGRQSHNYVRLYHDWTDTLTLFADGSNIPPDIRADLARRNVPVVDGRITGIAHHGTHNATVKLDTGPDVAVDILFAHPRNKPSASLHESLGLATVDTPLGIALKVDERRQTSMPGIYAAGDLANPLMPSVTTASWQGAMALALLPLVLIANQTRVIAREERDLEAKFGDDYRHYKAGVRRWL